MEDDIYRMQVEAALEAVVHRRQAGGDPHLEIMIPLVGAFEELKRMRDMIEEEIAKVQETGGVTLEVPVGTMIELPRAALIAGELAKKADFFSFGTNDLTQMTYGLSRDDAQTRFLDKYVEDGILPNNPFQTLDTEGWDASCSGHEGGQGGQPSLVVGVCGEHGGDPESIKFCRSVGLDYVSCSPPRIKVARLAAAQAELSNSDD